MAVRFFTFADCFHEFISLESRMNDSSLIRIHRLQYNSFSCFLNFVSNSSCKIFQSFFTALAIIFGIKFYTDVI